MVYMACGSSMEGFSLPLPPETRSVRLFFVSYFLSEPLRGFGSSMSTHQLASPVAIVSLLASRDGTDMLLFPSTLFISRGNDHDLPYEHTGLPSDRGGGESRRTDCRRLRPIR